ncbi:MobP2 family relaxase [Pediococcus damnosus]|uniref:MobP2 family relaxase n=1 Tax=Pediococcus damnosus TaxID=51663 RepID=UPI0022AAAF7C|nr:MobP2 family relaxase [Pediococcus damnosus]
MLTMKFTKPGAGFSGFVDYTQRDGAVDVENDYDLSDETSFEEKKEYAGYVDYMKRNKATKLESQLTNQELLPTFTATKLNITKNDENGLRKKLSEAEKQDHLLFEGVISFRTDLMIKQKVYDPITGHVDQKKIKKALQSSMPEFLKKNNLENATWWGDIHLNTDHLHIHFGIAEDKKSVRPRVRNGEEKGMLNETSMRQLRGRVYRNLIQSDQQAVIEKVQDHQGMLRKRVKESSKLNTHKLLDDELLIKAFQNLPDKKYRFSSNAKGLKKSKQYLNEYINNTLIQNSEYQEWAKGLRSERKRYKKIYGENNQDYEANQIKTLKKQVGNELLKNLYDISPEDLETTQLDTANKTTVAQDNFAIELLKRQIADLKKSPNANKEKLGKLRYELGARRGKLRKKNIQIADKSILSNMDLLNLAVDNKSVSKDDELLVVKSNEFSELLKLHQFELQPNYKLSAKEKNKKRELQRLFVDPIEIPINSRLLMEADLYVSKINREIKALRKTRIQPAILQEIYGETSKGKIERGLDLELQSWLLKRKIATNNQDIKNKPNKKMNLKHKNGLLFSELKDLYKRIGVDNKKISQENNQKLRQIEKRYLAKLPKRKKSRPGNESLRSLSNISQAATSDRVRALSKHEQLEEAEEQDIEREEQER